MIEPHLRVHDLPSKVSEPELEGCTVIVIDVLRATSTICQALASGAREVVPFVEIEKVLEAAKTAKRNEVVLGGERVGKKIPDFDLGNSPAEYTRDAMLDKAVFITTTNGTKAMHHARLAARVLLGSFLNLSALVESIENDARIDILCAGTDGHETDEDILAAGAIVHELSHKDCAPSTDNIQQEAAMAGASWSLLKTKAGAAGRSEKDELAIQLRETAGGRNCIEAGNAADLLYCAQVDLLHVVPQLDLKHWKITAS